MHVHIHTTIVSPSNQLRFKTLVKVDVNPADNLRQVLSQHDKSKKEDKYKILQYWDARNMTDPSNRIFIKTQEGSTDIMEELEVQVSVLKALNGDEATIMTIGLVIHVPCELDSFNNSGVEDRSISTPISCPSISRESCAFSHMMNAQKSIHKNRSSCDRLGLPGRKTIERNGKDRLHNRLIDFFVEKSISLNDTNRNDRDNAWNTFLNSLWRLNEVKITRAEWKVKPPLELDQFLGFSFYDASSNGCKRKRPALTQDTLSKLIHNIEYLQCTNWLHPSSNILPIFLDGLLRAVKAQIENCINKAQKMSTLRVVSTYQAIWKDCGPGDLTNNHPIDVTVLVPSEKIADKYKDLNDALAESLPYEPLMLHEFSLFQK